MRKLVDDLLKGADDQNKFGLCLSMSRYMEAISIDVSRILNTNYAATYQNRLWLDLNHVGEPQLNIDSIYELVQLPFFDPIHVIEYMNKNNMSLRRCENMIVAKINMYLKNGSKTIHVVDDFNESYLEYLVSEFEQGGVRINFKKSSLVFFESFCGLYCSRVPQERWNEVVRAEKFFYDNKHIKKMKEKLSSTINIFEDVDPLPDLPDVLQYLKQEIEILNVNGIGKWIIRPVLLVNRWDPNYIPNYEYQCFMYLFRGTNIHYSQNMVGNIDLTDLDDVIKYYIKNVANKRNYYRDYTLILERILSMSKGSEAAGKLYDTGYPLLRWFAEISNRSTKNSKRR